MTYTEMRWARNKEGKLSQPISDRLLDFIELNTNPEVPFSAEIDQEIQVMKAEVLKIFQDYEIVADRRKKQLWQHVYSNGSLHEN